MTDAERRAEQLFDELETATEDLYCWIVGEDEGLDSINEITAKINQLVAEIKEVVTGAKS